MSTPRLLPPGEVAKLARLRSNQPGRYLALLLLVPFTMIALVFPLARTSYFLERTRQGTWHAMDYHAHMGARNCSVLIFGDSTAMADVDPSVVEAETGLKTCNLSLVYMAWAATGDTVLNRYLKENPAPRLIVFFTHARHLHAPTLDDMPGTVDGWLMEDRISQPRAAARFFLHYPRLSFIFAAGILRNLIAPFGPASLDLSKGTYERNMRVLSAHNGFLPFPRTMPETQICALQLAPPIYDPAFASQLRQQYGTPATTVWLYASPVRDCDDNNALYRSAAQHVGIAPPAVCLPLSAVCRLVPPGCAGRCP